MEKIMMDSGRKSKGKADRSFAALRMTIKRWKRRKGGAA
jgi:hypothetical protein